MKVRNMTSNKGNKVPNQFIITDDETNTKYFQSYESIIARIHYTKGLRVVSLDINYWDYSRTTGKYRNQFLGETKAETQKKIDNGEYVLNDLN